MAADGEADNCCSLINYGASFAIGSLGQIPDGEPGKRCSWP